MDESRHAPQLSHSRLPAKNGVYACPQGGLQTQAGPVTGFGEPCASGTKEETPRDRHPHYPPAQEVGLLVHKESADHMCFARVTLPGCHTQAFITLAIQRLVFLVWHLCWAVVRLLLVSARISITYPEEVKAHCDIGYSDLLVADLGEFAG